MAVAGSAAATRRLPARVGALAILALLVGAPTVRALSPSGLMSATSHDLAAARGVLRIGPLLRHGRQGVPETAPEAATLTIELSTDGPGGGPPGIHRGRVAKASRPTRILASGSLGFASAGSGTLVVWLTPLGRATLRHTRRLRVYVWSYLTAAEGTATAADALMLRR
jgi:hypothetical protein